MRNYYYHIILWSILLTAGCGKSDSPPTPAPAGNLQVKDIRFNGVSVPAGSVKYDVRVNSTVSILLNMPVDRSSVASAISLTQAGAPVAVDLSYTNGDSVLIIQPQTALLSLARHDLSVSTTLRSAAQTNLNLSQARAFVTSIDSTTKFPVITDEELLTKVQQQTFRYFWDFGHPVSGMARERSNGDNNVVTSGGTGFGIMAIPVAVSRSFITRAQALERMQRIVGFLKNTAQTFHGAFPHWLNGNTGFVVPFSAKDNGADLVETSFLMAGLLTARQYFNGADPAEAALRADINTLWNNVEWSWFRRNNEEVLYWHWSPNFGWDMNLPIRGWNECLITYILAASSTTHPIPASVYQNGWAGGTGFRNGVSYFGYPLPLGPSLGGPLFLSHYSFLGVDPNGLQDSYAAYATQTRNHSLINYQHCVRNINAQFGYSADCWGLTASDIKNGYTASSPTNDVGVIAPTAALSSFPYTPAESMRALKFFYYILGDRLWKDYGFVDAFSLKETWFAASHLAIDQGPIIVMMENYRTGLIWQLFTSCPEVKAGMRALGFTAPYL